MPGESGPPFENDHGSDANEVVERIRELQHRLQQLALVAGVTEHDEAAAVPPEVHNLVPNILKLRARRRKVFGPALFGEPAWDMLLELYNGHFRGRRESVSSLCLASGVPQTTALRRIRVLESEGLIERAADPRDARRFFLALTDRGLDAMSRLFASGKISLDA